MAQPPPYDRAYSFTDHSANLPTTPQPGVSLDNEFEAIEVTTDAIRANLALIQRDDGALANASVGFDQLSAEVDVGLHSVRDWAPATAYALRDGVWRVGILYRCILAHTSSGAFATDTAKWAVVLDIGPYAATAASAAVTAEVLAGISLAVDLGPINTALAGKAGLATVNTFTLANTFNAVVTGLTGFLAKLGTAVTQADYFQAKPTDYGVGKPGFFIRKTTTANKWRLALDDGAAGTGVLDIAATSVTRNGVALITNAEVVLPDASITNAKYVAASVDANILAPDSVTTPKILDAQVVNSKLGPGAVTGSKVAAATLLGSHIIDGELITAKYADGSVTNAKLATGAAAANLGFTPADAAAMTTALGLKFDKAGGTISGATAFSGALPTGPGGASLGFRHMPPIDLTADTAIDASHEGALVRSISGTAWLITMYPVAARPFREGAGFALYNGPSTAPMSIIPQAGVQLYWPASGLPSGTRTLGTNGYAFVQHLYGDSWIITGSGIS